MSKPTSISDDFAAIVTVSKEKSTLSTTDLFNASHEDSNLSPIDQFIVNTLPLNKQWASPGSEDLVPHMGILLLLGYVSAVESYMRALIRKLINCDQFTQNCCEKYQLSYGAALHHNDKQLLPEALLEETVFTGKEEVKKALRKFIGYEIKDKAIESLLDEYEKICQLRHCCVHRFGKLGAKNAIALGLQSHKDFFEKPILLTKQSMESIAALLTDLVKSINNDIFRFILIQSATGSLPSNGEIGIGWQWHITRDKKLFMKYYSVFSSTKDSNQSPTADELYIRFKDVYQKRKK